MDNVLPLHHRQKSIFNGANRRQQKQQITTIATSSVEPTDSEMLSRSVDSGCRTEKYNVNKEEDDFYKPVINSTVIEDGRKLYGPIFESGLKELHYLSFNNSRIVRSNSDDSLNNNQIEDCVYVKSSLNNSSNKMDNSVSDSNKSSVKSNDVVVNVKKYDQIQYEIVQQGPDLQQDSPRSARSSPKSNAVVGGGIISSSPSSMSNSPATQHKNLLPSSDSPPAQNPVFSQHLYHHQQFSQPPQKFTAQQQASSSNNSPQHYSTLTSNSSTNSPMIFGGANPAPLAPPIGHYYNPAVASAYSQQSGTQTAVRLTGNYDPGQMQAPPGHAIFYQPLMGATMVPSGGFYYHAPAGMMNAAPPPYMVSAHGHHMPWTTVPAEYANLSFAATNHPTTVVYSHPSHQQQYLHQQQPFLPYAEFHQPTSSYSRDAEEIMREQQNREKSVERCQDTQLQSNNSLPDRHMQDEEETLVVFRKQQQEPPAGGCKVSELRSIIVEPQRRYSSSDQVVVDEVSKSNLKEQNDNYANEPTSLINNASDSPRHSTNRYHTGAKLELEHGRTPLFGQCPAWWGEEKDIRNDDEESMCLSLNVQSEYQQRRSSPLAQRKIESASDTEGWVKKVEQPSNQSIKNLHRENIRMDIPFSSLEPVEPDQSEKRKSGGSGAGSTGALSFTIEFTPDEDGKKRRSIAKPVESKAEDQWKTQSAERVHRNFVRRSLRKAGGITAESHPLTASAIAVTSKNVQNKEQELRQTTKDPKTYLLSKMLDGEMEDQEKISKDEDNSPMEDDAVVLSGSSAAAESKGMRPRRESDAGSDAGTYVVDRDQEQEEEIKARLQIDRVFGVGSRSSSSSCERSPSPVSYEEAVIQKPRPKPPVAGTPLRPTVYTASKKVSPTHVAANNGGNKPATTVGQQKIAADASDEKDKKGLLKQLLKISQQQQQQQTSVAQHQQQQQTPAARKSILKKNNSSVGNNNHAHNLSAPAPSTCSNFSRAETARLSLRTGGTTTPSSRLYSTQPFKPKSHPPLPKPTVKDNEMSLWLRRKEYNPMKAAAEGRTKKTSISASSCVDPPYLSNRSQSFHSGAIMPKSGLRKHQSIEDSLAANETFGDADPLSDSAAVAKYSRTFATSLNRLSSKPAADSDTETARRSTRALDVNSLTNLARLSKELGFHAKDVLTKLQISSSANSGNNCLSRSMDGGDADNVFGCHGDEPSEEDSLEHSGSAAAGITSLVKQLELANQAFAVVDKYLKNQPNSDDQGNTEPADPTLPGERVHQQNFNIRRTRLTKLDAKFSAADSRSGRRYSEKD